MLVMQKSERWILFQIVISRLSESLDRSGAVRREGKKGEKKRKRREWNREKKIECKLM
jgi:hypothetical protein